MFIRFISAKRDETSDIAQGIFSAAYELRDRGDLAPGEDVWFAELNRWFGAHLVKPSRFAWSSRPNAPERGVSWLKLTATDHVRRLRELAVLLEHKDVFIEEVRTTKPGYIVYEDEFQIVAIPFTSETFDR